MERTGRKKSAANTEAVVVVPVVGFVPGAPRRAHVPGVVVPGAAAKDTSLRATQAPGRLTCFQRTARPEDRWRMMSAAVMVSIAEIIVCGEIREAVLHTNYVGKKSFAGGYVIIHYLFSSGRDGAGDKTSDPCHVVGQRRVVPWGLGLRCWDVGCGIVLAVRWC